MTLTSKELMLVYIGYLTGSHKMDNDFKNDAMRITCDILKIDYNYAHELHGEVADGLESVNVQMAKMIKDMKDKKNIWKDGDKKEWR